MGEHRHLHHQPLSDVVSRVTRGLIGTTALSAQSLPRVVELLDRFARFGEVGHGVASLDEITPELVRAFVTAPGIAGAAPRVATQHLRRSAVRLLFRTARELGLATHDPTLDLTLPPRSLSSARPLAEEEVALCRAAALHSLTSNRLAAAWALAEATTRTAELPHLCVADLELDRGRVWVHGSRRTEARWGQLSDWGRVQLERRVRELGNGTSASSSLLVYGGNGSPESRQASSCQAIGETLRRAGLTNEPDVRPVSVAAWAGERVLADTGRIEAAARALGCRSLDGAARLVGFDWHAAEDER